MAARYPHRSRRALKMDSVRQPRSTAGASSKTTVVLIAWAATLLLSKLPLVIARDVLGGDIPWIVPLWILSALLLLALTYRWPALRPLRRYFAIMGLILILGNVFDPLVRRTAVWSSLTADSAVMVGVFADRILLVFQTLIVLGSLLLTGSNRRKVFLAVGYLSAPVGGSRDPGMKRLSWAVLAPICGVVLGGLFFLFLGSMNPDTSSTASTASRWLPLILLSAVLNAFGEEGMFRAAPLSTLVDAVGPGHAIWLTAVWFGFGHYYGGIPSGAFGLVEAGALGLLLGKIMLDTRGMGWSWAIHALLDAIIYFFLAASAS